MNNLQLMIFNLQIYKQHYEKMREKVINENSNCLLHHINGVIEGLEFSINTAQSLINKFLEK